MSKLINPSHLYNIFLNESISKKIYLALDINDLNLLFHGISNKLKSIRINGENIYPTTYSVIKIYDCSSLNSISSKGDAKRQIEKKNLLVKKNDEALLKNIGIDVTDQFTIPEYGSGTFVEEVEKKDEKPNIKESKVFNREEFKKESRELFAKSISTIKDRYPRVFSERFEKNKDWIVPIEEKFDLLKDPGDKEAIFSVIKKLRKEFYKFEKEDENILELFSAKISPLVKVNDHINRFKADKYDLIELFNSAKESETFNDFTSNFKLKNENGILSHLPHFYSVIKNAQSFEIYPLYYKYWNRLLNYLFDVPLMDYDRFLFKYSELAEGGIYNMLDFSSYLQTIGVEIANLLSKYKLSKADQNYFEKEVITLNELRVPRVENKNTTSTDVDPEMTKNSEIKNRSFEYLIDNGKEALSVGLIAEELAILIQHFAQNKEEGQMLGVFGRWGRGKTFLVSKIIEVLKNVKIEKVSKFHIVKFNAWKYQTHETSWAYLYEVIADHFYATKKTGWSKFRLKISLNRKRHGNWDIAAFLILFIISATWLFFIPVDYKFGLFFSIGISTIYGLYVLQKRFSTQALQLIKKYSAKKSFIDLLGAQAEIQSEIAILLKTWLPYQDKSNKNEKILLVVDDIDRCGPENIVGMLDALRVMLEELSIIDRVIVLIAVDERILLKAIENKYSQFNFDEKEIEILTREYIDKLFVTGIKLGDLNVDEKTEILNKYIDGKVKEELPEIKEKNIVIVKPFNSEKTSSQPKSKQVSVPKDVIEVEQENLEEKDDFEISSSEEVLLKEFVQKLNNPTPRQIRIFYYRYLMARNFSQKEGIIHTFFEIKQSNTEDFVRLLLQMIVDKTNKRTFDIEKAINEDKEGGAEVKYVEQIGSVLDKESFYRLAKIVDMIVPY